MPLDKDVYLGAIEREGQLLLKAADGNLGGIIPRAPGGPCRRCWCISGGYIARCPNTSLRARPR
jgi:hypothetical protein